MLWTKLVVEESNQKGQDCTLTKGVDKVVYNYFGNHCYIYQEKIRIC